MAFFFHYCMSFAVGKLDATSFSLHCSLVLIHKFSNVPRSSYSSLTIQIISNLTDLDLVQAKFCILTLKGCKTPEIQNHQSRTTNNQGQQTNSSKVVMWWVVPYCVAQLQNSSKLQTEPTEIKGRQTTSAIKINSDCQLLT